MKRFQQQFDTFAVLGPSLERFVAVADGHFWFDVDDVYVANHSVDLVNGRSHIEVWMRCQRGSVLIRRVRAEVAALERAA